MAKKSSINKSKRPPKFQVRQHNRCEITGRPRGYYRDFKMCRNMFRQFALEGLIPGVSKSSW